MENLQTVIDKIREIDTCLDKYEYGNRTYEEYVEDIKAGKHGNFSLRRRYLHGRYIWETIMQNSLDDLKETINLIYKNVKLPEKHLPILINNLKYTKDQFVKNTDNCGIYAVQSEQIRDNLNYVIEYLNKYMQLNNYEEETKH